MSRQKWVRDNIIDSYIYLNKGNDVTLKSDPQTCKVKTKNKQGDGQLFK